MEAPEKFINWLEGFLDASKNKLSNNQVREIRKKINEYHKAKYQSIIPIYDSTSTASVFPTAEYTKPLPVNENFLKEIENNKSASTMEDLSN